MRQKTWVGIFFLVAGAVVALVLGLALRSAFAALKIGDSEILGQTVTLTTLLGILIAGVAAVGLALWPRSSTFVNAVVGELNKVNWPSWAETKVNTMVVIATSVIAAIILGVFDITFGWASSWLADNF